MGLYASFEQVRIRLIGKVRFTDDEEDENRMHMALANRLISEGEGQLEQDLSPRYGAPFQTADGGPFSQLPARPTRELLRTMAELQACIRILETDFGSGTANDGEKYAKQLRARYKLLVDQQLEKKGGDLLGWKYPPLPGLRLNYMNTEADDGFAGRVLTTSSGDGDFPKAQINNPGQNWWNGDITQLDKDGCP